MPATTANKGQKAATVPTLSGTGGLTTSEIDSAPLGDFGSSTPTAQASYWQTTPQTLNLPTGSPTERPSTGTLRTNLQRGMGMLQLYGKLAAGEPLTPTDIKIAQTFGGTVARAAELVGPQKAKKSAQAQAHMQTGMTVVEPQEPQTAYGKTIQELSGKTPQPSVKTTHSSAPKQPPNTRTTSTGMPVAPATTKQIHDARIAAQGELGKRIQTTLGITPTTLNKLTAKVPKQLASMMQNAGYPVTTKMTTAQALNAISGVGKTAETPADTVQAPQTVSQFLQQYTSGALSATEIGSLQSALYQGGWYTARYYEPSGKSGVQTIATGGLTTGTMIALQASMTAAAKAAKTDPTVTWGKTIRAGSTATPLSIKAEANAGFTFQGTNLPTVGTGLGSKPSGTGSLVVPSELQGTLETAMESYLGRLPTQGELTQFASYYTNLMQQGNKSLVAEGETSGGPGYETYQTGIPYVAKVPTPSAAAEQFVQNTNAPEYQATNIDNSFGMLMNLIDRQNTSAYTTIGAGPDRSS